MSMDTNKEAPGIDRERIPETITFRTADRMPTAPEVTTSADIASAGT